VDAPVFLDTVQRYNKDCTDGLEKDTAFGKPLLQSKPFDTPPYFAIQMFLLARKNFGGVKTDMGCRVLDKHFQPISGLYAAGEVAGMAGGHINGSAGLEGTMLDLRSSAAVWPAPGRPGSGLGNGFTGKPNR